MESSIKFVNGLVWGVPMLSLLLLTGLYLTFGLRGISIAKIPTGFAALFSGRKGQVEHGDVSPFAALMTALSSTVGTGNIAGVAAAIAIGGPGAVFWMWMTAIVGTATKFSEGVLAVNYREIDANGHRVGGPMYYIKNGLGPNFKWLAILFAFLGTIAAWGTGASIQANSVADALKSTYGLSPYITATALALGAAAVILGGIKRIGRFASAMVPTMALLYIGAGLIVIIINGAQIPAAFSLIFKSAFGLQSAGTGISIGLLMLAMKKGVARGIFSNEAGQGSAPIAHAAAQNDDPVNQGLIAMLGTVIDTLIICTITALVILTSGVMAPECLAGPDNLKMLISGEQAAGCDTGAPLTAAAFNATLTGIGEHIVAIGLTIFAFTTILGWSYYGERCITFLAGTQAILAYRISWIAVVFASAAAIALEKTTLKILGDQASLKDGQLYVDGMPYMHDGNPLMLAGDGVSLENGVVMLDGAAVQVEGAVVNIVNMFWLVADTLTGLMAAPNLIALLLLSPVVFKLTKAYFTKL